MTRKLSVQDLEQRIRILEEESRNGRLAESQREAALRESEQLFRELIELAVDGILTGSPEGVITGANSSVLKILGMEKDTLLGKHIQEIFSPQVLDANPLRFDLLSQGKTIVNEREIVRLDGKRVMIEMHSKKMPDGSYHSIIRDITERKQAEFQRETALEALRESQEMFRVLADSTPTAVMLYQDDRWVYVNRAATTICGYSEKELLSMNFWDIVHPKFKLNIQQEGRKRQQGEDTTNRHEFKIITKDGTEKWVDLSGASTTLRGRPAGIVSVLDINERKQADEALRKSEVRQGKMVANIGDVIVIIDQDGINRYKSPNIERWFGWKPDEVVGISAWENVHPEDLNATLKFAASLLDKPNAVGTVECRYRCKDGSYKWIEFTGVNLQHDPDIGGILGNYHDITERKQAESQREDALKALQESEGKYRNLFENAPVGIFRTNSLGRSLAINETMGRILGFASSQDSVEYYKELGTQLYVHAERRAEFLRLLRQEGRVQDFEYEARTADGRHIWLSMNARLEKGENEEAFMIEGFTTDITERKQALEALKKSKEMLRLITENMSDMIRVTDLQGSNIYVSPSHLKGLGYTMEERVGMSGFDIVHPDDVETIMKKFTEGLPSNQPIRVEYRVRHADGHYVWLDTVGDLLRDDQGNPTAVVMSSRDISERKLAEDEKRNLEERLNRAEKMEALGQLAGGVAHDLNNVLGVLTGYSELLLIEIPEGQRARGYAEKILRSTENGAAIIQDLLTLARRGVTVSDVINLNSIVSGFLKTPVLEKMKDYHPRVTFRTECEKDLLNIKGSTVHLEKTLMNLVSNASEAISGKGEVTIRTENRYLDKPISGYDKIKEGDYAVLSVSDTGAGIPAENREKIFEPFYTKKTMGRSGTGLGLAIVWGTVKDHHGYIDVLTKIGEGTTFTLYFPVTREELIAPQKKEPIEKYMGNGESILVVDDIAEQRDIASGLLTRLGYAVHVVSSGEEAVEYLKENKADILVLDMIMVPGIDGLETYQRVLEVNPKQKAILVSGFSETDRVREAQKLGAGAYVKKPYVMEKIGVAIRDELSR